MSLTGLHGPQVAFERVPDLVAQRRVLLRHGWAYVSRCALLQDCCSWHQGGARRMCRQVLFRFTQDERPRNDMRAAGCVVGWY